VYSEEEFALANREAWFDAKAASGFPVLVAPDDSGVLGFGTFGEFRAWPCYRYSVEHSVHARRLPRPRYRPAAGSTSSSCNGAFDIMSLW